MDFSELAQNLESFMARNNISRKNVTAQALYEPKEEQSLLYIAWGRCGSSASHSRLIALPNLDIAVKAEHFVRDGGSEGGLALQRSAPALS